MDPEDFAQSVIDANERTSQEIEDALRSKPSEVAEIEWTLHGITTALGIPSHIMGPSRIEGKMRIQPMDEPYPIEVITPARTLRCIGGSTSGPGFMGILFDGHPVMYERRVSGMWMAYQCVDY